jgi:hypothetical protein
MKQGAKGLISPLEDVFQLETVRDCRATGYLSQVPCCGASFVLWKQDCVRGTRGAMRDMGPDLSFGNSILSVSLEAARAGGLICSSETDSGWLSRDGAKGRGPHLSFGSRLRLEAARGMGPHLSFGNVFRLDVAR